MLALTWTSLNCSGYFPVAPGTAGTAAAVPCYFYLLAPLLHRPPNLRRSRFVYALITIAVTGTGILAADRAGKYYGVADSGHIVIDEVAGYLVTMFMLPWNPWLALGGFLWFRVCDVLKPWPARFFDRDPRWKNGAGRGARRCLRPASGPRSSPAQAEPSCSIAPRSTGSLNDGHGSRFSLEARSRGGYERGMSLICSAEIR